MGYLHFEVITEQIPKRLGKPSGDVTSTERDKTSTYHTLCDGVGSGAKANITATMCVARLGELIRTGLSIRQAFANIVHSMEDARKKDMPLAFFTVARILPDGVATILTYEMPEVIFISKRYATRLKILTQTFNDAVIGETNCILEKGEGILLFSDGISQAGLGKGLVNGWGIDGINKFVNDSLRAGCDVKKLPKLIIDEAKKLWKNEPGDDLSVSLILCRKGKIINLLTGPPVDPKNDESVVKKFLSNEGLKIVCGASTAKIVARELGKEFQINPNFKSEISPPDYEIEGIDLVTEGAVTLNQLYNIWDEDTSKLEKDSPVTILYSLLSVADRVNLYLGNSKNPASEDISFVQQGILKRDKIIKLLVEKLIAEQKLVHIEAL
ncbi:MAG: SpoIIE family protein phosphatase [Melioribacteraceae bacterium]|nr:SpoIIE family protein phosphatase [Melioribacteraceae bacterium]